MYPQQGTSYGTDFKLYQDPPCPLNLVFFWLALRTNFLGVYMNYNKEAKSLTFRRGSEVSQVKQGSIRSPNKGYLGSNGG